MITSCSRTLGKSLRPCKNAAWWPGGFCHIHSHGLSVRDWLFGIVSGARNKSLPKYIELSSRVPVDNYWTCFPSELIQGESKFVIHAGSQPGQPSMKKYHATEKLVSFPEDFIVGLDYLLSVDSSPIAIKLAQHVTYMEYKSRLFNKAFQEGRLFQEILREEEFKKLTKDLNWSWNLNIILRN